MLGLAMISLHTTFQMSYEHYEDTNTMYKYGVDWGHPKSSVT